MCQFPWVILTSARAETRKAVVFLCLHWVDVSSLWALHRVGNVHRLWTCSSVEGGILRHPQGFTSLCPLPLCAGGNCLVSGKGDEIMISVIRPHYIQQMEQWASPPGLEGNCHVVRRSLIQIECLPPLAPSHKLTSSPQRGGVCRRAFAKMSILSLTYIHVCMQSINCSNIFLNLSPNTKEIWAKVNKWDIIKL